MKSKWADELIGEALEGKKELTEMQRAAVIEELYVF